MKLDILLIESFDLKDYNLKKVNKKEIIEIFENYDFENIGNKEKVLKQFNTNDLIFGWLYKNYIIISINERKGYESWHFLDVNNLDTDEILKKNNVDSIEILKVVFNIIYNKMIQKGRLYKHIISTPDERRFKLYKQIIEKVIKKFNIQYTVSVCDNGLKLTPVLQEGSFYY